MIKNLAAVGVGAALFLAAAVPAFAYVNVHNQNTSVYNDVTTYSKTGENTIHSDGWTDNWITTGNALSSSVVGNTVNSTAVDACGCEGNVNVHNQNTSVHNDVTTYSKTGQNTIHSDSWFDEDLGFGSNGIHTGNAAAQSVVGNEVNTTVVGF